MPIRPFLAGKPFDPEIIATMSLALESVCEELGLKLVDDPATRPIRAALEARTLKALIDARCLNELTRVLDYPQFVRMAVDKAAALATLAQLSQLVAPEPPENADERPLPKCRDRDDQKFLELAHASKADWLVSKDRAVLKLARRTARDFGIRIAQPAPFVEVFEARALAQSSAV